MANPSHRSEIDIQGLFQDTIMHIRDDGETDFYPPIEDNDSSTARAVLHRLLDESGVTHAEFACTIQSPQLNNFNRWLGGRLDNDEETKRVIDFLNLQLMSTA